MFIRFGARKHRFGVAADISAIPWSGRSRDRLNRAKDLAWQMLANGNTASRALTKVLLALMETVFSGDCIDGN
jgi:hypothetical protein